MFEKATRIKLRFESKKGLLSVEQLWDLPLNSLDEIAISLNKEVKDISEVSFIKPLSNNKNKELTLKFNIVKHIIDVKLTEIKEKLSEMKLSLGMDLSRYGISQDNIKEEIQKYLEEKKGNDQ